MMWSCDITSHVTSYTHNGIYEKCQTLGFNKMIQLGFVSSRSFISRTQLDYQYRQFYNLYGIKFDRFINSSHIPWVILLLVTKYIIDGSIIRVLNTIITESDACTLWCGLINVMVLYTCVSFGAVTCTIPAAQSCQTR